MSESLVIFAGNSPQAPVDWRLVRSGGAIAAGGTALLADMSDIETDHCVLVLPGDLVSAREIDLAARSERQLLAAAPFAIEEQIATELDTVHVAVSPASREAGSGQRIAYVVDAGLLSAWNAALGEAGFRPAVVLADYLALPAPAGRLVVAGLDDRILLRQDDWGAGVDRALGAGFLDAVIEMRVAASGGEVAGDDMAPDERLDQLASSAAQARWGLLQGRFATRNNTGPALGWKRLRLPATLAALAAISLVALNLADGFRLRAGAQAFSERTESVFRAAVPEAGRVVNPRAQLRALVRDTGGGAPEFLILSAYVAEAAQAVPAIEVSSLRFDGQNGQLDISILFRSYDELGRFRDVIEQAGGRVEEGGSRQQGELRAGELIVRRS